MIFSLLRRCFELLPPGIRRTWLMCSVLLVAGALIESACALAVLGLLRAIDRPDSWRVSVWGYALTPTGARTPAELILTAAALVAVLYLVKNALSVATAYVQARLATQGAAVLASRLFRSYLGAPYEFHLQHNSTRLTALLTLAVRELHRSVLHPAATLFSEAVVLVSLAAITALVAPVAALATLALLGGLLVAGLRMTRSSYLRFGEQDRLLHEQLLLTAQHGVGGIKEVRIFGREGFFAERFADQQRLLARVRLWADTMMPLPRLLVEMIFVIGMLVTVAVIVTTGGERSEIFPLLGLFAYAGFRIVPSITRITAATGALHFGAAAVSQLLVDLQTLEADPPAGCRAPIAFDTFRDRIELAGVTYRYPGASGPALADVSFEIRRGESIGVVGPTGGGKTTLVSVLLGLLAPQSGHVKVDGRDLHREFGGWQGRLGYVPQDTFLIDDTLEHNVAFGLPAEQVDRARVARAVAGAQLDDLIASLPRGLETVVGERGVRLSGGQRQRVAIARALYFEPEVLVFDEATSSLDALTERQVVRAIESLRGTKTLIIIGHRFSTISTCDRLVLLRDGKVDDQGAFRALLERNDYFRSVVTAAHHS